MRTDSYPPQDNCHSASIYETIVSVANPVEREWPGVWVVTNLQTCDVKSWLKRQSARRHCPVDSQYLHTTGLRVVAGVPGRICSIVIDFPTRILPSSDFWPELFLFLFSESAAMVAPRS